MTLNQLYAGMSLNDRKQDAELTAKAVKTYLEKHMGGDWKIDVWHNLHWCSCLKIGSVNLHWWRSNDGYIFSALISSKKGEAGGGDMIWTSNLDKSNDPVKAVDNAMKRARDVVKQYHETLNNNKFLMMQVS